MNIVQVSNRFHKNPVVILLITTLFFLLSPLSVSGQDEPLRVGIKISEPFIFEDENELHGFSIELWEKIAQEQQWTYEYQYYDSVPDLLAAAQENEVDLSMASLSITSEREQYLDFSYPVFNAGLQILVRNEGAGGSLFNLLEMLFQPPLSQALGMAAFLFVLMAHLMWLFERKPNPAFDLSYIRGIWEGFWWTIVTLTTVGYGDQIPRGVVGRILAMIWMFTSIFLISYLTATITTTLTLQELRGGINSPEDLPGKRVATLMGTTSSDYLRSENVYFREYENIDEAYNALLEDQVDAIVFDSPILRYFALSSEGKGRVHVVGSVFQEENYGIAFPAGSPHRETVNTTLLELYEDGTYRRIYDHWFGDIAH